MEQAVVAVSLPSAMLPFSSQISGRRDEVSVETGNMDEAQRIGLFVGGAQKGGTTSLHGYLRQHPQLSAPDTKELHIFDDEAHDWSNADALNQRVTAHFAESAQGGLRFACTPVYGFWPQALERIHAYNPRAKLVFLYRDPFARAWSHWCMEYARGAEYLPFAEAIRAGRQRLAGLAANAPEARVYSYVERGRYGAQLRRALELFPAEQMLLLRSLDLAGDHHAVLARISRFLGLAEFPALAARRDHAMPDFPFPDWPTTADRDLVMAELAEDLADFRQLSGFHPGVENCVPTAAVVGDQARNRNIRRVLGGNIRPVQNLRHRPSRLVQTRWQIGLRR